MSYVFHLVHIMFTYLKNDTTQSKKWSRHLENLCVVFLWFYRNNIPLNPFKWIIYVTIEHILGFIVSKKGVTIDTLKFQDIPEFTLPQTLHQL